MEQINGHIKEIIFNNPMDGFTVMMIQSTQDEPLHKIVGYFCPLSLHEYIEVRGILEDHSVHGLQLISKRFTVSYPKGVDDIEAYLKQGAIPGLSAKEIEKLLDKHGSELLRVMSGNPNLLVSTTSLSKKKIERIKKTLKFHADIRELSTYLLSNGLKPGYADSIYTLFSDSFQQQIQQNPYQLCQDFIAIPFPDVDRLALRAGFEESSTERIKAALDYVMHIQGQKGFFHIDYHALIQQCQMLTELEDYQIKSALDRMITRSEYLLQQKADSTFMVFTKYTEKRLKRIFSKLKSITQTPLDQFVYITDSGTSIEKSFESTDQAELVFQLLDDHIGAEKITIINTTRSSDFYVEQCIPFFETNNISYCCFDKLNKPDDFFSTLSYNSMTGVYEKNAITHLPANCILIANAHLLSFTDLYAITEAMNDSAQIILIGDTSIHQKDQQGAIFKVLTESDYCHSISHHEMPNVNDLLSYNAQCLVKAKKMSLKIRTDGNFFMIKEDAPHRIMDHIFNLMDKRLPKAYSLHKLKDIQVCTPSVSGNLGAKRLNQWLRNQFQKKANETFSFASGDKVIQRIDDHKKGVFLGQVGYVTKVNEEQQQVHVHFGEKKALYQYSEMTALEWAFATAFAPSSLTKMTCTIVPIHESLGKKLTQQYLYNIMKQTSDLCIFVGSVEMLDKVIQQDKKPLDFSLQSFIEQAFNPSLLPPIRILDYPENVSSV